jgi:fatty acid desaturase
MRISSKTCNFFCTFFFIQMYFVLYICIFVYHILYIIFVIEIIFNIHLIFVFRCCHAYTQRIESQLEEFRMEMERVRSRSDAILNMLNMLHSVEMN